MSNPALQWISQAYQGGYLRTAFIDCQRGEYKCLDDKTPFTTARNFVNDLRKHSVPISHFLYNQSKPSSLQPFFYKGCAYHRFPNRDMDFEGVIPKDGELVFPKETYDGFTNPFSGLIINEDTHNPNPSRKSVLITAGFTARACVLETTLGSFKKAAIPENHFAVIALNATNLPPEGYTQYIRDVLEEADPSIRDRISFSTTEKIIDALNASNPSQFFQHRPYRALGPQG